MRNYRTILAAAFGAAGLVSAVSAARTPARVASQGSGSLAGEAGLAVWRWDDSVTVAWLTEGRVPGRIEVFAGDHSVFHTTTQADSAHRATVVVDGDTELRLVYGGEDAATAHETRIRGRREARKPRVDWPAPDSIVVISDIHGEFDRMQTVLQNAGVLDAEARWTGGTKHLVIVGDIFDRGAQTARTLWTLYALEPQAEAAGGQLHVILGNHELMVMLGDLRYLSRNDSTVARLHDTTFDRLYHPAESVIGRWLVGKPGVLRLGDLLFAHGGVSTDYATWNLDAYGDSLFAYTHEELFNRWTDSTYIAPMDSVSFARRWDFMWGPRSVFWYRGYARADTLGAQLDSILDAFDARTHIVGHTPHRTITQTYGGRFVDVNTVPFAAEALLLVRNGDEWERLRIRETGPPEPVEPPAF